MPANTRLNRGLGGDLYRSVQRDSPDGPKVQVVTLDLTPEGASETLPSGALPVSGVVAVSNFPAGGGLTDTELRATPVPVSGTVTATTGGLTDVQLRATAVPVSGPVTDAQLRAAAVPVSGSFFQATQPVSGTVAVSNLPATQPISAAALPLPADAATQTTLALIKAKTDNIDVALSTRTKPADVQTILGVVAVSNLPGTQPVSGPLTDAQLRASAVPVSGTITTGGLTDGELRATPVPVSGTVATGALTDTQLRATPVPVSGTVTATTGGLTDTQLRASAVPVSGPVTDAQIRATPLPISGTVTANLGTIGTAATEATLSGIKTGTDKIPSSPATDRATAAAPASARLSDGSAFYKATTPADTQPVSAASLPLPALASTSTLQTTGNASLSSIDGKLGSLGQKAMAGSAPVVIASDQSAVPVSGSFFQATQPVSGPLTDTQLRATPVPVSGTVATGALTDSQLRAAAVPVSGSFFQATQPVSAASLPLPSGAATAARQDTMIAGLQALNSLVPSTYDYISLSYVGEDLTTVLFKSGGSGGTLVSTLTLAYTGTSLTSVTRT